MVLCSGLRPAVLYFGVKVKPTANNELLRELRKEHGLSNKAIAAIAEVHLKTVESWFAGSTAAHYRSIGERRLKAIQSKILEAKVLDGEKCHTPQIDNGF